MKGNFQNLSEYRQRKVNEAIFDNAMQFSVPNSAFQHHYSRLYCTESVQCVIYLGVQCTFCQSAVQGLLITTKMVSPTKASFQGPTPQCSSNSVPEAR